MDCFKGLLAADVNSRDKSVKPKAGVSPCDVTSSKIP